VQKTQNPQNGKIPENYNSKTENPQTNKRDRHQTHAIICDRHRTHKAPSVIGMEPIQCNSKIQNPQNFVGQRTHKPSMIGLEFIQLCDRHRTHKPTRVICMEPIQLCVTETEPLNQQVRNACNLYNYVWQTLNFQTNWCDRNGTHKILCDRHRIHKKASVTETWPTKWQGR